MENENKISIEEMEDTLKRLQKIRKDNADKLMKNDVKLPIVSLSFGTIGLTVLAILKSHNLVSFSIYTFALFVFVAATSYGAFYLITTLFLSSKSDRIQAEILDVGNEKLKYELGNDFFSTLIRMNFGHIDKYYGQTHNQAKRSFVLACSAAIIGFLIIILGVVLMLYGETAPAYVTTAAGIVSEFISAVFYYLFNQTVLKMSHYHQKLVVTQNITLALKITDSMEDKELKDKAQYLLVDRLSANINEILAK